MKDHPTRRQQYKHTYLTGPMGVFAIHIIKPNGTEEINYIHKDHLGSWNTITDEEGNLLQELSFDAWGNRRDPATWRAFTGTPPAPLFDRGFTGHEHLYAFNLINMNGRVYDPIVGRMLSPDLFIQAPGYSQNFNRYSYCLNNPLVYTDPSGEFFMMPFFLLGMVADFTSNLINGVHDPLGTAYSNVTSTITGINNSCQIPVARTDNFYLSVGIDPFSFGVSINAAYKPSDDFAMNFNAGIGPFGGNVNFGASQKFGDFTLSGGGGYSSGFSNIFSKNPAKISGTQAHYGFSYYDRSNNQYFSFGGNTIEGKYSQNQWFVGYRKGDFSFAMTNDAFRGSDWYRTAAAEIGIGEVSFGFNLFTTEPPLEEYKRKPKQLGGDSEYISPIHGKNPLGTYSSGSRVYAGMYLGYRNGNRVSRFGIDAAWVQDLFQNGIHRWVVPTPYFNTNSGSPSAPFLQGGYVNPFSLYTF
jgi:RHS repeat-associated protein